MADELTQTTENPKPSAPVPPPIPVEKEPHPQLVEGHRLLQEGKAEEAIAILREAQAVEPENPTILENLGLALMRLDRYDEACEALESCLLHAPRERANVCNSLGRVYQRLGRLDEAEASFREAIEEHFQFYQAHFNLGLLLLSQGRFPEGFREYEWRWQTSSFTPFRCLQPRWKGRTFNGTLLVHTEQGAGDTLQFCRYLPLIRQRCKRLIFVCPERMASMFTAPHWADEVLLPGTLAEASFDAYLPLMSAPFVLGTELESIPADMPYLTPEPRSVELGTSHVSSAKLKVGLVWGGSPTHANDQYRSCPLKQWESVLNVPGVAFYSLQNEPQRAQLHELDERTMARIRDLNDLQKDFSETAAILKQLDLLITVDTAILHLAGGLALPAWGLLSGVADWRWLRDRESSPWYPTLQLFRQETLGDWPGLMNRVAAALRTTVANP